MSRNDEIPSDQNSLDASDLVMRENIQAIIRLKQTHGNFVAAAMARGLLAAGAHMLKNMYGSKAAARELYTKADQYACE